MSAEKEKGDAMEIEDDIMDDLDALMPSTMDTDKVAKKLIRKEKAFHIALSKMMYGGGDDEQPLSESVQLMEYIITDFIESFCIEAQMLAEQNERSIRVEDFLFLIRKDPTKYKRVSELLEFFSDLRELRKNDYDTIHRANHIDNSKKKKK